MEPLRPDEDQLAEREAQTGKPTKARAPGTGSRQTTLWLLLVLVVIAIAAGGWALWQQQQDLASLNASLERAQAKAQQNRLQLGSFDQEQSQTGQAVAEQLDMLDSEMRKLWVIAHQRNHPAIEMLQSEVESLKGTLKQVREQVAALNETSSSLESGLQSLRRDVESVSMLDARVTELKQAQDSLAEQVESQLNRVAQDRRLALEEVTARLDGLRSDLDSVGQKESLGKQVDAMRGRLDELEGLVESIDSARGQLTQRFIQLRDRVDSLAPNRER